MGEGESGKILSEFRRSANSILPGTHTFWQGVDIPGENLVCVIITRLPFEVPDDPLTEARCEWIERREGHVFHNYTLPNAVLMFRQGFGRLIRTKSDWGVVAVLDPRILSKSYGSHFLHSLPSVPITYSLGQLEIFVEKFRNRTRRS
ncbi:MAG: ATP-dependent DNA helicase [bacterium]